MVSGFGETRPLGPDPVGEETGMALCFFPGPAFMSEKVTSAKLSRQIKEKSVHGFNKTRGRQRRSEKQRGREKVKSPASAWCGVFMVPPHPDFGPSETQGNEMLL
jgi:hypothetical protein